MSEIRISRGDNGEPIEFLMWDPKDIAEYCGISIDEARDIIVVANNATGGIGYDNIEKEKFMKFWEAVQAEKESRRLQDEANAAQILFSQKNHNQGWISIALQALGLLSK